MKNVFDVANFFIDLAAHNENDTITNLRLNKLLFFAQAIHLSINDVPLFDDDFIAMQYGPVITRVYEKYKRFVKNNIDAIDKSYTSNIFNENELDTLLNVVEGYGKYSTTTLVNITHVEGSPWDIAYKAKKNSIISKESIKEYYKTTICENRNNYLEKLYNKIPDFQRDENGVLIIPRGSYYAD